MTNSQKQFFLYFFKQRSIKLRNASQDVRILSQSTILRIYEKVQHLYYLIMKLTFPFLITLVLQINED